ncbi:MAG: septal ring lytic transglycosylase RlpA family protein [Bacteroidetes bacterium]|nr:septal ring lytic transglycosylase RlpA family protein [Bacteroidota bacterium]
MTSQPCFSKYSFLAILLAVVVFEGCTSTARFTSEREPGKVVFRGKKSATIESTGEQANGVASFYGPKFHGRQTASGEIFDMYQFTAAHRQFPFGTRLKVTNLDNGKSVIVRVNDRGPFVKSRVLDLSYAAAKDIDMVTSGVAKVKIETYR